ncbi:hypothetical protein EYF80_032435 [Liparis tanakae]|uniref:Uncharacterized protein n=1 Tax=Liparis tanakae TaxID=230148 RepID=A0A4Z2GV89_9TELE|nr:hypothetical protein EYF80_032435 [Liparis tanakae]
MLGSLREDPSCSSARAPLAPESYDDDSGGGLGTIRGFIWASILPLRPRGHVVHTWSGDAVDWLLDLMELMAQPSSISLPEEEKKKSERRR